jgi:DMSO/TMAO reductase YedYZ molybdopterin-dependent catalytic subunit
VRNNQSTPILEKDVPPPPPEWGRIKKIIVTLLCALGAGLVAGFVSVVCMLVLRLVAGIPTPVELFGDFILKKIPAPRFVDMLAFFSPNSKLAPLGLTMLAMIALGALLGLLYAPLVRLRIPISGYRPGRREWLTMLILGVVLAAVGAALFWTEIRQNFLGLPIVWSRVASSLGLLLDFMIYALVLGWCYRALLPKQARTSMSATAQSRRALLTRTGVAILGLGAAGGTFGLAREYARNYASYDGMKYYPPGNVTSPITPNSAHYVVTQNPIDPTPSLNVWRLEVTGLVGNAGSYTYEEFTSLPSISRAVTLECIANGVNDHLISTAIWQGVTFRSLLAAHGGAQPSAKYVAFYSVDGYTVSQPLEEVLRADALLAFRMNGAEIPTRHGYPVRVLIPGHFGEESPKWVTRIELTDQFVGGLYSDQDWYNGPLHTMTRIDRPHGRVAFQSTIEIGGIAFAGYRGIQRVEVSTDDGATWHDAQLAPPLSQDSWVLWTYQWQPTGRGHYTLLARATDGTGQTQTSQKQGTVPNGGTGYSTIPMDLV